MAQSCRTVARTEPWSLDGAALDQLLVFLDPDRDVAAAKYEDVRRRLLKLFAWRRCAAPEEYADRTIDRVARRLREGAEVRVADPYQYFHGVALNVLREHWREPARTWRPIGEGHDATHLAVAPEPDREADRLSAERHLSCLRCCLGALPEAQRAMLIAYHASPGQIERRQALAQTLSIPINALRIRVHRLRSSLEGCASQCMKARSLR